MKAFAVFVALAAVGSALAQLSSAERDGIRNALTIGNLAETDLHVSASSAAPSRLGAPMRTNPLDGADALLRLHAAAREPLGPMLTDALSATYGEKPSRLALRPLPFVDPRVPAPLRIPVGTLVDLLGQASDRIRAALGKLTPAEQRELIEGLPGLAASPTSLRLDFVKTPTTDEARLRGLLAKVDLGAIRSAGVALAAAMPAAVESLRRAAAHADVAHPLRFRCAGMVVELAGKGDDVHTSRDAALCIDLGGDNVYTGRYGAGIGYASALIDLGGNSRYDVGDLSVGAGLLGVGVAIDFGHDDTFSGRSLTFGAGLAGVGVLWHAGGDRASYRSRALAQGFGAFGGIGVLRDDRGEGHFDADGLAQGAGAADGLGWLAGGDGDDLYRARGLQPDPLNPAFSVARAQGYGGAGRLGLPPGQGLLTDLGGDDVYLGGELCQAAGESGGLGSLADDSGNDTYRAAAQAQSYAADGGMAVLADLAGDDSYAVQAGLCHATAEVGSVAILLDRSGDDLYAARDDHPGSADAGGVAIFLDAAGSDCYSGRPAAAPAFGGAAVSLFVDLGGADQLAPGLQNGEATAGDARAVAYAASDQGDVPLAGSDAANPPAPGSLPAPADAEIAALFDQARSGDAAARNRLVGIGKPALQWVLSHRLGELNEGGLAVAALLLRAAGGDGPALLKPLAASPDDAVAAGALRLAAATQTPLDPDVLKAALQRPALRTFAVRAVGVQGLTALAGDVAPLAATEDPELNRQALIALRRLNDPAATSTAQAYLLAPDLTLRTTAQEIVAGDPVAAILAARGLLSAPEERSQRIGIELLGRIGTPEALALVAPYLQKGTPGTKISALLALDGRFPPDARDALDALRNDANPLVRAVAQRVDPGR